MDRDDSSNADEAKDRTKPTNYQALARRQAALLAITIPALLVFAWLEDSSWAVGLTAVLCLLVFYTWAGYRLNWWRSVALTVVTAFVIVVAIPNFIVIRSHGPEENVVQGLHAIRLAVERYAVDEGTYPPDMESLRFEGYLPYFPENRYYWHEHIDDWTDLSHEGRKLATEMKDIAAMEIASLNDLAGNFAYIPVLSTDDEGITRLTGYKLLGFARYKFEEDEGIRVNIVLDSKSTEVQQ